MQTFSIPVNLWDVSACRGISGASAVCNDFAHFRMYYEVSESLRKSTYSQEMQVHVNSCLYFLGRGLNCISLTFSKASRLKALSGLSGLHGGASARTPCATRPSDGGVSCVPFVQ